MMEAQQFAYWLQGFSELNEGPPTAEQWQSIRDHLATVFTKITPPMPGVIIKDGPGHVMRPQTVSPLTWPSQTSGDPPMRPPYTVECKSSAAGTYC